MDNKEESVGLITEQGDMGLGYTEMSDEDKKVYTEQEQQNNKEEK